MVFTRTSTPIVIHTLRKPAAAAALTLLAPIVHASLIFSFSFDNSGGGNTAGPITGEIHGLEDNKAQQAATKVVITGIGSHTLFGHSLPFDVIGGGWTVGNNAFAVTGGSLVGWNFASIHDHLTQTVTFELLDLGTNGSGLPVFAV